MTAQAEPQSGVAAAGRAALSALEAENRACAARLRACYELHQVCVDEQLDRDIEAGRFDSYHSDLSSDSDKHRTRVSRGPASHAVLDPFDVACAELVARYGVHHHRASAMLTLAVDLVTRFPAMITAMESGRLDERTASMLARHMRTVDSMVRWQVQRAVVEWLLETIESGGRPGRDAILSQTDRIIEQHDPAGVRLRRAEAVRERHVSVRRAADGMADLCAHLTAAEAHSINAALDSAAKTAHAREKAERVKSASSGRDELPLLGERRHCERRADALMDAVLGSGLGANLAGPTGESRDTASPTIRPVITVLAPLGPDEEPQVYFPRSGPASIEALVALLARSTGATISLPDPESGSADTADGRRQYRISTELARRVRLRDGTCRHPGCSVTSDNCDIDHAVPFSHAEPARGGPTAEANLMCLCRRHHRFKTFHDWRYRLARDGTLTVTTSSGHTVTTTPDGPLARWRHRSADERARTGPGSAKGQGAVADDPSWLNPRPSPTHWFRRARRIAAERQRRIDAMLVEAAEAERADVETANRAAPRSSAEPDNDPPPF